MEYRSLGNSNLKVSVIGLGGNNFGWWSDRETSARVIHRALDLGINFIDTADMYDDGRSEEFIGSALKERRHEVILATKFGAWFGPDPTYGGGSRKHILRAVEASLKRLRTDYIDLYQMHIPDPETPLEETLATLDELVQSGKVRQIGCSNFPAPLLEAAIQISAESNLAQFVSLQSRYNLLERDVETTVLPSCLKHGIGFIPWGPLAGGFLTGKYRPQETADKGRLSNSMPLYDYLMNETNYRIVDALRTFAVENGHTPAELAIGWLLANPAVTCVIPGARLPEQVDKNLKAGEQRLATDEIAGIEAILSGL